ncbi:F-box only protein 16-like [Liolophura sinensis]|uniref:F-box only protein 16-like n=1 Tax=Liolophura sinensis TaxID=3198878 RepID=UPI0031582FF0
MSMIAKNRLKSSWTPLSNEGTNNKLFEERRALVGKWFDKWNSEQRKIVLGDLIDKSKVKQLEFTRDLLQEKCPTMHYDLTRSLPRFLSIYIFSFLDPRSLCRCSQVCWYWKLLSELDQLWMPKCLRLGWYVPFTPGPYETGAWKRTYIEHIKSLKVLRPSTHLDLDKLNTDRSRKPPKSRNKNCPPPWRGSDPKPTDIWRNNVLDNDDVVNSVVKLRERGYYSHEAKKITQNAHSRVKTGANVLTKAKRSKSAPRLIETAPPGLSYLDERPQWGSNVHHNTVKFSMQSNMKTNGLHTGHGKENTVHSGRPLSATTQPTTKSAFQDTPSKSARDPPTTPMFPQQPWKVAEPDEEDE